MIKRSAAGFCQRLPLGGKLSPQAADEGKAFAQRKSSLFLAPYGATEKDSELYHSACASWYNDRSAAIIPPISMPFFSPLTGWPKKIANYTIPLALHGIMDRTNERGSEP
nr:hypothetical protein [Anaerofilum sp. An201]